MKIQLALLGMIAMAGAAQGSLLYAPSASDTVLNTTFSVDDTTYTPAGANAFTMAFPFFGVTQTAASFRVNNNGWVNFGGATTPAFTSYSNQPFPFNNANASLIAPMWDDLYMTSPNTAVGSQSLRVRAVDAGTYVITWAHEEYFLDTTPDLTFQAILYGAGNGSGAADGTIIFCYDVMTVPSTDSNASFTAGLNKGSGGASASLPGYPGSTNNAIAVASLTNTGWTFTPDGAGGYSVSQGKTVPTPGALALAGIGGLALVRRRR